MLAQPCKEPSDKHILPAGDSPSSNLAYFVQVARSYTGLMEMYLIQGDQEGAHAMLTGLAQYYTRHVVGIRGHLDGQRYDCGCT